MPLTKYHSDNHRLWVESILQRIGQYYGDPAVSVVVFGSCARGENRITSDLDVLVISESLSGVSRFNRHHDFVVSIEEPCDTLGMRCHHDGISTDVSCLLLTPDEARAFNPLYLDMIEHHAVIRDDGGEFAKIMTDVGEKIRRWGTKKFAVGGRWGWQIKPHARFGEALDYDQ